MGSFWLAFLYFIALFGGALLFICFFEEDISPSNKSIRKQQQEIPYEPTIITTPNGVAIF